MVEVVLDQPGASGIYLFVYFVFVDGDTCHIMVVVTLKASL